MALAILVSCNEPTMNSPTEIEDIESNNPWSDADLLHGLQGNKIVIANRLSGTISVIDTKTDDVIGTYDLSDDIHTAEPMYVVYNPKNHSVFVGDRANDRVIALNADDFSKKADINTGSGVFHMWADPRGKQLWVNNDIDNSITVIDPSSFTVITTVDIPSDLVNMGGKPHDVVLGPFGQFAYVSIVGFSGDSDYIIQYNTNTFSEVGRVAVGKDPHLSLTRKNQFLYVPCQGSNAVYVINRYSLKIKKILEIPGAHGAGMALNGRTFYTTNLPGGGSEGLWAIDTRKNKIIGSIDSPNPIPHNIALTPNGKKLYITHSGGTADQVSIYTFKRHSRIPVYSKSVTVGLNPFGLTFVK